MGILGLWTREFAISDAQRSNALRGHATTALYRMIKRSPGIGFTQHRSEKFGNHRAILRGYRGMRWRTLPLRSCGTLHRPSTFESRGYNAKESAVRLRACRRCQAMFDPGSQLWERTELYMQDLMASAMSFASEAPHRDMIWRYVSTTYLPA